MVYYPHPVNFKTIMPDTIKKAGCERNAGRAIGAPTSGFLFTL